MQLASRGQNIILIARNKEKLENVSKEISKRLCTFGIVTGIGIARESRGEKDVGLSTFHCLHLASKLFVANEEAALWDIVFCRFSLKNLKFH